MRRFEAEAEQLKVARARRSRFLREFPLTKRREYFLRALSDESWFQGCDPPTVKNSRRFLSLSLHLLLEQIIPGLFTLPSLRFILRLYFLQELQKAAHEVDLSIAAKLSITSRPELQRSRCRYLRQQALSISLCTIFPSAR